MKGPVMLWNLSLWFLGKLCLSKFWRSEGIPSALCSVGGANSPLVGLQVFDSPSSCLRMLVIFGRTGGDDSYSSSHIWTNNAHSISENPTVGLSGRFPLSTS